MLTVTREDRHLSGTILLPFSKSMSIRAQLLAFLHPDRVSVKEISCASDAVLLKALLEKIGAADCRPGVLTELNAANSAAVVRFLTAILAGRPGQYLLKGSPRMAKRPVGILVEALRHLGADIIYQEKEGFLPIAIQGKKLSSKKISIDATESSQYISALMLLGTTLEGGIEIVAEGEAVSEPYIGMTAKMLEECGFRVPVSGFGVEGGEAVHQVFELERDWSGAAFWYGLMANAEDGELLLQGLKFTGMQADEAAAGIFSSLGVVTEAVADGIRLTRAPLTGLMPEWDFRQCPDLAPAVMAACAFLPAEAVMTGLERLQIKESDRLRAMQEELARIGCMLLSDRSGKWHVVPGKACKKSILFNAHDDHRIAMAMVPSVFKEFGYVIDNESVVEKSYPGFWDDLRHTGFIVK